MEVKKIDCGAELVLHPVDERIGEVRLLLLPTESTLTREALPPEADNSAWINFMAKYLIGWNLEADGVAIPCNDETKAKYFGYLTRLVVKAEDGQQEIAAVPIMRFTTDINNF